MCWNGPRLRSAAVLIVFCSAASIASAQWAWRDENGRTVYADVPPPAGIKPGDILQQPSPAPPGLTSESPDAATQSLSNVPAAAAPRAPAPPPPTTAEREQEFRKRMKARAEAEQKQADALAQASRNAEDCERARGYMKTIEDGMRLVHTNPDGSRELLDEAQRDAEVQRTRAIIEERCK